MQRDLRSRGLARLVVWTGDDGPVTLGSGSVGVEYRGRLGHPSSYGLLGAHLWHIKADPGVRFDARPSVTGTVIPPVPCDVVHLGLHESEYFDAIRDVADREHVGFTITAAAIGEIGSSRVVFARLATVLARIGDDPGRLHEQEIWQAWEEGWPSPQA